MMLLGGKKFRVGRARIGGSLRDRDRRIDIQRNGWQAHFVAACLVAQLEWNSLSAKRGIRQRGERKTNHKFILINVQRRLCEGESMQLPLGIRGIAGGFEAGRKLGAQLRGNEIVSGRLARIDVKAGANLGHHGKLESASARDRLSRNKCRRRNHFASRRNLRRRGGQSGHDGHKKGADNRCGDELHTFTGVPSCCETTRLITSRRFSPVLSEMKVFLDSDQPSLMLVESAEIQISRTGVFGDTPNFAFSGSSKITSSFPLSPSTSKPCSSPTTNSRRFKSSNALSAFRWNSFSSSMLRAYQSCDSMVLVIASTLMMPVMRLMTLPSRLTRTLVGYPSNPPNLSAASSLPIPMGYLFWYA